MARPLTLRQRQELAEFVNALFAAADYPSTAEWARASGYSAPNLSELRNAKTGVDGYNLLRLIRAAAERMDVAAEDLAAALEREIVEGSPESIDSRLRTLSDLVTKALAMLEERLPAEPPASQRTRGGSQKGRGKQTG